MTMHSCETMLRLGDDDRGCMIADNLITRIASFHAAAALFDADPDPHAMRLRIASQYLAEFAFGAGELGLEQSATLLAMSSVDELHERLPELRHEVGLVLAKLEHEHARVMVITVADTDIQPLLDRLAADRRDHVVATDPASAADLVDGVDAVVSVGAETEALATMCTRVRSKPGTSQIPIIALTDARVPGTRAQLATSGVNAVLPLATDPDRVADMLTALLAARRDDGAHDATERPHSWRILVCDDDPVVVAIATRVLESMDMTVVVATHGSEVLSAVSTERPDLVLLDIWMPGRTGLEVLGDIRRHPLRSETPVLISSGDGSQGTITRALALGAADYILKPFTPQALRSRVLSVLRPRPGRAIRAGV